VFFSLEKPSFTKISPGEILPVFILSQGAQKKRIFFILLKEIRVL